MSRPPARPGQARPAQPPRVDFICKPKFSNTLPDIPFDGKFLACPFVPLSRFIDYKPTMLEKEYKFDVQCEMDMGVNIDLVNPDAYKVEENVRIPIDEKDQILLEDENVNSLMLRRSAQHSKVVPWMRKTEYISSEFNRFGVSADRQEIKVGYNLKKNAENENLYRDKQSQIDAINKTFDDVKKPVTKHYSKKDVIAVEELPVFPDFELWKYAFAQIVFDADPSYFAVPEEMRRTVMKQSLIKGMRSTDNTEDYVGYFAPTMETMQKRMEDKEAGIAYDPEHVYTYVINREYNFNVKNKASKGYEQDNYFLYQRDGAVYYNELETQVKLTRKRRPMGEAKPNSLLHQRHRENSEQELATMTSRLQNLMNPTVEEEEEDDDEEMDHDGDDNKSEKSGSGSGSDDDDAKSNKSGGSGKSKSGSDSDKNSDSDKGAGSDSDDDESKKSSAEESD